jgi:hypothetical protein
MKLGEGAELAFGERGDANFFLKNACRGMHVQLETIGHFFGLLLRVVCGEWEKARFTKSRA